jgi:hypothetical protein
MLVVIVVVIAGCGGTKTVTETVTAEAKAGAGPPSELSEFGYIKSLTRDGDDFRMTFDPAWFLTGETASVAAAEDGAVEPGEPVPNDNYRVDEGHRLLTYLVPPSAEVTVLTEGPSGTPITVAQLADLVAGKNPLDGPLFEPLSTGFWIRVDADTVRSLDQQYLP